jgi:hypothetical protein
MGVRLRAAKGDIQGTFQESFGLITLADNTVNPAPSEPTNTISLNINFPTTGPLQAFEGFVDTAIADFIALANLGITNPQAFNAELAKIPLPTDVLPNGENPFFTRNGVPISINELVNIAVDTRSSTTNSTDANAANNTHVAFQIDLSSTGTNGTSSSIYQHIHNQIETSVSGESSVTETPATTTSPTTITFSPPTPPPPAAASAGEPAPVATDQSYNVTQGTGLVDFQPIAISSPLGTTVGLYGLGFSTGSITPITDLVQPAQPITLETDLNTYQAGFLNYLETNPLGGSATFTNYLTTDTFYYQLVNNFGQLSNIASVEFYISPNSEISVFNTPVTPFTQSDHTQSYTSNFLTGYSDLTGGSPIITAIGTNANLLDITAPLDITTPVPTVGNSVFLQLAYGEIEVAASGAFTYIDNLTSTPTGTDTVDFKAVDGIGGYFIGSYTFQNVNIAPIVLSLNASNQINLVSSVDSHVTIGSLTNSNDPTTIGWVGAGSGILVYDPTHSGQISNINQISFTSYLPGAKTDLQGLVAFDTNHDGKLDAGDAAFTSFSVLDNGKMVSLAQLGITSISLTSDNNEQISAGNIIHGMTSYQTSDGVTHAAADVSFTGTSVTISTLAQGPVLTTNDVIGKPPIDFSGLPQVNDHSPVATVPYSSHSGEITHIADVSGGAHFFGGETEHILHDLQHHTQHTGLGHH